MSVIDASKIFSGAPADITYGGVSLGATITVPKFEIDVESGAPQFTNAGGPVKNTQINRRAIPSVTATINQLSNETLGWALPGSTGGTWTLGRVPSDAYKDLVVTQAGADGSILTLTIKDAISAESQSIEFDDDPQKPDSLTLKFTGFYDEAAPSVVPFSIVIA